MFTILVARVLVHADALLETRQCASVGAQTLTTDAALHRTRLAQRRVRLQ